MENYMDIIRPMKRRYISMFLEIEKLSGLFQDASAGGIVWKERRRKGSKKKQYRKGCDVVRYAYYQFYDKRKQKGKRKVQRYIRREDTGWAFLWVNERRKKWKKLKMLKQEIKRVIKGLLTFSVSIDDVGWEIKAQKLRKGLKKARKKPYKEKCRYMTAKGDLVRSRAERKIANELYDRGISYLYEQSVSIHGKRILPDFIIFLNGKMIIWEHLGMLDIPEYAAKWKRKMLFYETIGFIEGVNLIVTTEKTIDGLSIESVLDKLNIE